MVWGVSNVFIWYGVYKALVKNKKGDICMDDFLEYLENIMDWDSVIVGEILQKYKEMKKVNSKDDLQIVNENLKERIAYLERSNDRREDTILEQRNEIAELEMRWNKLKENLEKEGFEINKTIDKLRRKHNTQQKEFISFLEDNWNLTHDIWYIKILQKYKEIIGVSNDNKTQI